VSAKEWCLRNNIKVYDKKTLHAKCYLNESFSIIASMNLYHYSMVNNIEFGVLFNKDEDEENYNLILNEFSFLKEELQNPIEIITLIKIVEECEIVDVRLVYH